MDRHPALRNRLLLLCAAALLVLHAAYYYPFFCDDSLISLRYARRLISGLGLTWTDGPPVEGYTNLLWVLLNAALGALGVDLIWSARVLGTAGAFAAIVAVSSSPQTGRLDTRRLLSGGFVLAATAPVAVWAVGGLEQGFMTGVLAVGLLSVIRLLERPRLRTAEILGAGAAFGMLALLRADGALLFGLTALGVVLCYGRRRATWWLLVRLAVVPTLCVAGQLVFRLAYYGDFVPNTARVKVGFRLARLWLGLEYVEVGSLALNVLWIGVAIGLWVTLRRSPRHRAVVPAVVAVGWAAYIALVGGDIFPGWRQLLPAIVPLVMLTAEGARQIKLRSRLARHGALVLTLLALPTYLALQTLEHNNYRAKEQRWEWDGEPLGDVLKRAFGAQRPLMAVDSAGALPYWSDLPCLDMLGLNDKYLAMHPPAHFGTGEIGHELGDGAYLWRRRPEIIAFNKPKGEQHPKFHGGKQLLQQPDFHTTYQLIRIWGNRGRPVAGLFYLRYEDGLLAIQRTDDTVRIPGYLFSYSVPDGSRLDNRERLVTPIAGQVAGHVRRVRLEPGTWRATVQPSRPAASVDFLCRSAPRASPVSARGSAEDLAPAIEIDRPTFVDVVVAAAPDTSHPLPLAEVALTRGEQHQATHSCPHRRGREVALSALAERKPNGTYYAFPGNEVIDRSGLHVVLPRRMEPTTIEISVDRDDTYEIHYELDREDLGVSTIRPATKISGLTTVRLDVPEDAQAYGTDRIVIVPSRGDGRYAVGHLRLHGLPAAAPE